MTIEEMQKRRDVLLALGTEINHSPAHPWEFLREMYWIRREMSRYERKIARLERMEEQQRKEIEFWERMMAAAKVEQKARQLRPANAAKLAAEARRADDDDQRPARQHPNGY